jgi:hypothetical protein
MDMEHIKKHFLILNYHVALNSFHIKRLIIPCRLHSKIVGTLIF